MEGLCQLAITQHPFPFGPSGISAQPPGQKPNPNPAAASSGGADPLLKQDPLPPKPCSSFSEGDPPFHSG